MVSVIYNQIATQTCETSPLEHSLGMTHDNKASNKTGKQTGNKTKNSQHYS